METMAILASPRAGKHRVHPVITSANNFEMSEGKGSNSQERIKRKIHQSERSAAFFCFDKSRRAEKNTVTGASHRNPAASEMLPRTAGKCRSVAVQSRKCDSRSSGDVFAPG